jgi:hypothetical protein
MVYMVLISNQVQIGNLNSVVVANLKMVLN